MHYPSGSPVYPVGANRGKRSRRSRSGVPLLIAGRKVAVKIDYCGFRIPDKFVVGYGIDYQEDYRYLSYIGYL